MSSQDTRGFTLIELIITMVIVSIAVLGVTYSLSFAFRHHSDGIWQAKSVALAQSYLDEIVARRYDEVSPPGGVPPCSPAADPCTPAGRFDDGETRAEYDDVDDYDGIDDSPPVDGEGVVRPNYDGYRIQVTVSYPNADRSAELGLDDPTDAKMITVAVSRPSGGTMRFTTVRSNF